MPRTNGVDPDPLLATGQESTIFVAPKKNVKPPQIVQNHAVE